MNNDTRKNAVGKWRTILLRLGFTEKELSGKHGPCPICEGTDRFRYTDYKDNGDYFCSACGAGSGFDLIMKKNGWTFSYAAKEVDILLGQNIDPVFKPEINIEKRRANLNKVWQGAKAAELLGRYLDSRRITGTPLAYLPDLRGHAALFHPDGERYGGAEAMVALIRNRGGVPISIHRTYIGLKQRKIMPPTETIKGAGIRLGTQEGDTLVIGEGIETTLSGMEHFGHYPGIATISAYGMEELMVPHQYVNLIILADNDASFTGQKAAFTLARRMDNNKRSVRVVMLAKSGADFNDRMPHECVGSNGPSDLWEWNNGR